MSETTSESGRTDPERVENLADDLREIYEILAESPRGLLSTEVAEQVDLARTTVRDKLDVLIEQDLIESEAPNRNTRIYYVEGGDSTAETDETAPEEPVEECDHEETSVLTSADYQYLATGKTVGVGTSGGKSEQEALAWLSKRIGFNFDGHPVGAVADEEEMRLLSARLGLDPDTAMDRAPRRYMEALDELLKEQKVPFYLLYAPAEWESEDRVAHSERLDGPTLKLIREALDVPQGRVAEEADRDQALISRWESGKTGLKESNKKSVVEYLRGVHRNQYAVEQVAPEWLIDAALATRVIEVRCEQCSGTSLIESAPTRSHRWKCPHCPQVEPLSDGYKVLSEAIVAHPNGIDSVTDLDEYDVRYRTEDVSLPESDGAGVATVSTSEEPDNAHESDDHVPKEWSPEKHDLTRHRWVHESGSLIVEARKSPPSEKQDADDMSRPDAGTWALCLRDGEEEFIGRVERRLNDTGTVIERALQFMTDHRDGRETLTAEDLLTDGIEEDRLGFDPTDRV